MWKQKRKLEAEAPEAAIFYGSGSGSGKHEMNGSGSGSGSSKKILEAEAEAIKNSPLPHHCLPASCKISWRLLLFGMVNLLALSAEVLIKFSHRAYFFLRLFTTYSADDIDAQEFFRKKSENASCDCVCFPLPSGS